MKRNEIIFLTSFPTLASYYVAAEDLVNFFSKKFKYIYFVNCENLKLFFKEKKFDKKVFLNFPKKIKFINPKNFNELDLFLKKKNPLIINNIGRGFEFYRLLFFIRSKRIPQILIGHVGNIQASTYYWHNVNFKLILFFFTILLPRWISRILVFLQIFSPIDIRFVSNRKHYDNFIKNSKKKFLFKFPKYYKELILVKSKIFDSIEKDKNNLSEKYILLLDLQPEYRSMTEVSILKEHLIKKHYENLNSLLSTLSKKLKKEVIISIHPEYDLKKTSVRFKNYKVVKMKTKEYIKKSFLVLFFDSSAILSAITLKKKIICLQANLFKGRRYNSDLYKEVLRLKSLNISKKITFNKTTFLKDLNKRINFYDNYLKIYASSRLPETGSKSIINIIKDRYF